MSDHPHIMIVEARFYEDIADELVRGAAAALEEAGATYERIAVPGAFEIPGAIRLAMDARRDRAARFDGYVALGCIIRGETTHYEIVCRESARGLQELVLEHKLAIGYGILTVENRDQAMERGAVDKGDKGRAAVLACLAMIGLAREFSG